MPGRIRRNLGNSLKRLSIKRVKNTRLDSDIADQKHRLLVHDPTHLMSVRPRGKTSELGKATTRAHRLGGKAYRIQKRHTTGWIARGINRIKLGRRVLKLNGQVFKPGKTVEVIDTLTLHGVDFKGVKARVFNVDPERAFVEVVFSGLELEPVWLSAKRLRIVKK